MNSLIPEILITIAVAVIAAFAIFGCKRQPKERMVDALRCQPIRFAQLRHGVLEMLVMVIGYARNQLRFAAVDRQMLPALAALAASACCCLSLFCQLFSLAYGGHMPS